MDNAQDRHNATWTCETCGAVNPQKACVCRQCSEPRDYNDT